MSRKSYLLAYQDFFDSIFGDYVWFHLAKQEVKQRYRRSVLGPFWITISTGIMVVGMGPLYSYLLKQPVGPYFQYIAISFVLWNFISSTINDSCFSFISAEGFIKVVKLPYTTYTLKILAKNFIVFLHNFVIILFVLFFYPPPNYQYFLYFLLGLFILLLNMFWIALLIGMLSARFRDIPQVVSSGMQFDILFFQQEDAGVVKYYTHISGYIQCPVGNGTAWCFSQYRYVGKVYSNGTTNFFSFLGANIYYDDDSYSASSSWSITFA